MFIALKADLENILAGKVLCREQVSAEAVTTFGLGAPLPLIVEPRSIEALSAVIKQFAVYGFSPRILGHGSNVVLPDEVVSFPVIQLGEAFRKFTLVNNVSAGELEGLLSAEPAALVAPPEGGAVELLAFAQTNMMMLSQKLTKLGLGGFEYAAGIPASIGGALYMNAGAHGWSICNCLRKLWLLNARGEIEERQGENLNFGYRSSGLNDNELIVAGLFVLQQEDVEIVRERRRKALDYRQATQPLQYPSAGSVFRNPSAQTGQEGKSDALSAGKLLDDCGLKGQRCGGVEYSTLHANWLIRVAPEAKTADVLSLLAEGKKRVQEKFGLELHSEIKFW
ncbi:MAG: UDP-N-acetylmuramate dehydrogenase [Deltaproteobacteria bacterium]|nr:UDP-N-acetylmuramate dehydrogenase [Deltaproteobacteria bacterium]